MGSGGFSGQYGLHGLGRDPRGICECHVELWSRRVAFLSLSLWQIWQQSMIDDGVKQWDLLGSVKNKQA